MKNTIFEEIKEENLMEVLQIYNYYVVNTTVTFHTKPLNIEVIREKGICKMCSF